MVVDLGRAFHDSLKRGLKAVTAENTGRNDRVEPNEDEDIRLAAIRVLLDSIVKPNAQSESMEGPASGKQCYDIDIFVRAFSTL